MGRGVSPLRAYLKQAEKEKVLPRGLGFVNRHGVNNKMDLHDYSINDDYANALS